MATPEHMLTVDVEDWPQSTRNHGLPIGERVVANTRALLEIFAETKTRVTFFVLGKVAEKYPDLAREIAKAGHEVATHGYSHESLESMSAKQFREELHKSVEILQDQIGAPIYGHRAADFSISSKRLYFLEYILREGLSYDSSIMPVLHRRHAIAGAYQYPHFIRCASRQMLIEFPPATIKLAGIGLAGMGGTYLQALPYWCSELTLRHFERAHQPATCYCHSYDIEERTISPRLEPVLATLRLKQFLKTASIMPKLRRLLGEFRFVTIREACEMLPRQQLPVALDLAVLPIRYGNVPLAREA